MLLNRTRSLTHFLCWSPFKCRCLAWICLCWVRQNPRRSNVDGREKGSISKPFQNFNQHPVRVIYLVGKPEIHTTPSVFVRINYSWVNSSRQFTQAGDWSAYWTALPLTISTLWTPTSKKKRYSGLPHNFCQIALPISSNTKLKLSYNFTIIQSKVFLLQAQCLRFGMLTPTWKIWNPYYFLNASGNLSIQRFYSPEPCSEILTFESWSFYWCHGINKDEYHSKLPKTRPVTLFLRP